MTRGKGNKKGRKGGRKEEDEMRQLEKVGRKELTRGNQVVKEE